ncbi:MAG TPA: AAA family ATPase [Methylococcaceae bacterium]|jgi:predicted ATP-dependent protease|nr:AAA family ATPase [Methylococcaceae bacterium]
MEPADRPAQLAPEQLKAHLAPEDLPFTTTEDLEPFTGVLGQKRAQVAVEFGVSMARPGYNIYVMGEPGTGRLSLVTHYLQTCARHQATPPDWIYLNNFGEPREPFAIQLPAGQGKAFRADMEAFIDNLLATFPAAFENPTYQRHKTAIDRDFNQRYSKAIDKVERRALEKNIALFRDGDTISFSPMIAGKPADENEFAQFSEEEKEAFHKNARILENYLGEVLVELPQWKRETSNRLRRLNQETISQAIEPLLETLTKKYADQPGVIRYLGAARGNLLRTIGEQLLEHESREEAGKKTLLVEQYAPKLLVAHTPEGGAPVIYEANPTYQNLFGRVEYVNAQGALVTNYRMICAGALHQANGGYLLLDADKLVTEPHVWPALKRALKNRQIRIEIPHQDQSMATAMTLNPEVIPLQIKIVLIGERALYYLLQELDDEFNELFRVLADFDGHIPRDSESMLRLIRLVKTHTDSAGCKPLTSAAAARLIEYSARLAEHQQRLSARIGDLLEMVGEAELIRKQQDDAVIDEGHIETALANKDERLGRISQQLLEEMMDGTILIDTQGSAVGRINGLTVLEVGDSRFGSPARITATVYPGSRGVVDIEREVELGQAIHSKGVMILAGYLGHQYAQSFPLAISANIALEQSYGYVDGDSASLAEVCALISALTGVPIRQALAVTGSINQYGDVQSVGGVNEKIEGFFRLCQARKLTGEQGVIIPKANIPSLMLKSEVVAAVQSKAFAIYAVGSVDETLALVTGKPVRAVNALAVTKLRAIAKLSARTQDG